MKDRRLTILMLIGIIVTVEVTYIVFRFHRGFAGAQQGKTDEFSMQKELAEAYLDHNLYEKAVATYEEYLRNPALDNEKKSNISYIIGNIYKDNLSDYKNALASFLRAKVLFPSTSNISEINKKIVMCLENMGRFVDAERELAKATSIEKKEKSSPAQSGRQAKAVARIGDRIITIAEVDAEIENLPASARGKYKEKSGKLDFLRQYIAGELLYDSAKKRGFDSEKDIVKAVQKVKKQLMIDKLFREEIESKIPEPEQMDLKLYYEAHKDRYTKKKKDEKGNVTTIQENFEDVRDVVRTEYIQEKQQKRFNDFINNLMKTKEVEIYEDAFGGKEE